MARQLPPVDDDVFEALQQLAEPLVDDVNSVLRRLLRMTGPRSVPALDCPGAVGGVARDEDEEAVGPLVSERPERRRQSPKAPSAKKRRGAGTRAARGTLLPEREYELPLLRALDARGGSAAASEVIEDVGAALGDRLTEADREVVDSGLTRWKNRVQFVRLKLVQAGHMKKDSPRGVWEITPAGRDHLQGVSSNE